jgi:hypothetical protein
VFADDDAIRERWPFAPDRACVGLGEYQDSGTAEGASSATRARMEPAGTPDALVRAKQTPRAFDRSPWQRHRRGLRQQGVSDQQWMAFNTGQYVRLRRTRVRHQSQVLVNAQVRVEGVPERRSLKDGRFVLYNVVKGDSSSMAPARTPYRSTWLSPAAARASAVTQMPRAGWPFAAIPASTFVDPKTAAKGTLRARRSSGRMSRTPVYANKPARSIGSDARARAQRSLNATVGHGRANVQPVLYSSRVGRIIRR